MEIRRIVRFDKNICSGTIFLILSVTIILFTHSCKSPASPVEMIKLLVTVLADYTIEGTPASGAARFVGNGLDVTVGLGQEANLGTYPKGELRYFTIYIDGDHALQRIFKDVDLQGTVTYHVNILNLQNFEWSLFYDNYPCGLIDEGDNINTRWNQNNIKVIFFPSPGGLIQSRKGKDVILKAIEDVKNSSRGFIQSITTEDNDNIPSASARPPDGEIWILTKDNVGNPSNIPFPGCAGDGHVDSAIIWYYPWVAEAMGYHETIDGMFGQNQNPCANWASEQLGKGIPFLFSRPVSDSYSGDIYKYRIFSDHEEEAGFTDGISGTISRFNNETSLSQFVGAPQGQININKPHSIDKFREESNKQSQSQKYNRSQIGDKH